VSEDETGSEDRQGRPSMKGTLWPLALATQLGVTMGLMTVITVLAGLFLGSWVDRRFGTRPAATLLFILMAVLAGFLGTINLAQSTTRRINAAATQQVRARTAFLARDLSRAVVLVIELALVTLVPIGFALWLGLRVDRAVGSSPLFTIALSVVSIIAALVAVFLVARGAARRARSDS
jgi:F0F1-type ATP synthase assembly protein I